MWLTAGETLTGSGGEDGGDGTDLHGITGSGITTVQAPEITNPIYVSSYGDFGSAYSAATSGDTIVVDGSFPSGIDNYLKDGVDIVGEEGTAATLNYDDTTTAGDILRTAPVDNVHIHNLTVDAIGSNASRVLGSGTGSNTITNLTVTGCTFLGANETVGIRPHSKDNLIQNVSFIGTEASEGVRHGMYIGTDNIAGRDHYYPTGETENVLIKDCVSTDIQDWIAITLSGRPNAPCYNTLITDCRVERISLDTQIDGHAFAYEDYCHDNWIQNCEAYDLNKKGYSVSGQGFDNIIQDNYVQNCDRGVSCDGSLPHSGDPYSNTYRRNEVDQISYYAIWNPETIDPDNEFIDNVFTNVTGGDISDPTLDYFENNTFDGVVQP